jgi:hypothetical protein
VATVSSTPARADTATLYVAQAGNDSGNTCALATSPCATVSQAVSNAASGDTIYVKGTIDDNVNISSPITLTITQWPGQQIPAVLDGAGVGMPLSINVGSTIVLSRLTIRERVGGGIYNCSACNLTIHDSAIVNNAGGGIFNDGGLLIVENSTVSSNTATGGGGGVYNIQGTAQIIDSTISGNAAGYGSGIYNVSGASLAVIDSTISGNTSSSGGGGGIANVNGASLTITASTIADNSAPPGTGGGISNASTATIGATIVAENNQGGNGQNCSGALTSVGYNLTNDSSGAGCGFSQSTDVTNANPYLDPLADNGGPTQTQLPSLTVPPGVVANPAVAVVPFGTTINGISFCPGIDQRSESRPQPGGTKCTIGAVEVGAPAGELISNCSNDSQLQAAAVAGGSWEFTCSGTIRLTQPIAVTHDLELNAGHNTVVITNSSGAPAWGASGDGELFAVQRGNLTLRGLALSGGWEVGQYGGNGLPGGNVLGLPGGACGNGGAGGTGGDAQTDAAQGGDMFIAAGATVTLIGGSVGGGLAQGGDGGFGGFGATNCDGPGGSGGNGGNGGSAQGGGVYVSTGATLDVEGTTFSNDMALYGGGGTGGDGGSSLCGDQLPCPTRGASGGSGGNAGNAEGGAIYNAGTLDLSGAVFTNDGVGPNTLITNAVPSVPGCLFSNLVCNVPNCLDAISYCPWTEQGGDGGPFGAIGPGGDAGRSGTAEGGAVYNAGTLNLFPDPVTEDCANYSGDTATTYPPAPFTPPGGHGFPAGANGQVGTAAGPDLYATTSSTVNNCGPLVQSVSPNIVPLNGGPADTITVTGQDFGVAGSKDSVEFCFVDLPVGSPISCLPGANPVVAGPDSLTVTAPDARGLALLLPGEKSLAADTIVTNTSGLSSLVNAPADVIQFGRPDLKITYTASPRPAVSGLTYRDGALGFDFDGICVSGCADFTVRVADATTNEPVERASVSVTALRLPLGHGIETEPPIQLCTPSLSECGNHLSSLPTDRNGLVQLVVWLPGVTGTTGGFDQELPLGITAKAPEYLIPSPVRATLPLQPHPEGFKASVTFSADTLYWLNQLVNVTSHFVVRRLVPPALQNSVCSIISNVHIMGYAACAASTYAANVVTTCQYAQAALFFRALNVPVLYWDGLLPAVDTFGQIFIPLVGAYIKVDFPADLGDFLTSLYDRGVHNFAGVTFSVLTDEVSTQQVDPITHGTTVAQALYVEFQATGFGDGSHTFSKHYLITNAYRPDVWLAWNPS